MDFSLAVFGLVYLAIALVVGVIGFLNVALAIKYGQTRARSAAGIIVFIALFSGIVASTIFALRDVQWSETITVRLPGLDQSVSIP